MDVSKLPDWRIAKAAELATDGRLPNGASTSKGDLVLLVTLTHDSREGLVHFPTPGAPSLAISIATKAANRAVQTRSTLAWQRSPAVEEKVLDFPQIPRLFDYFEEAMTAATFSFQALESFANQLITDLVKTPFTLQRKDGPREFDAEGLERQATTEEKLATILPHVTSRPTPKGKAIWARFKRLKAVRDSTIHLKSADHYRRGDVDRESLYSRLLDADAREFPRVSIELMRHFSGGWGLDWLRAAEAQLNSVAVDV